MPATHKRGPKGPSPSSWERMWRNGIPEGLFFDAGKCEPGLVELINAEPPLPKGLALVPGCGRGYAVEALAQPGSRYVIALEVSPTGAGVARDYLREQKWASVIVGDFFTVDFGELCFDLIYDCTFLCALRPDQRKVWAHRMFQLLVPGGELVIDIFPIGTHTTGPPFAMSEQLVRDLLEPLGFVNTLVKEPVTLARPKTSSGELISRWAKETHIPPTPPSSTDSP